MRIEKDGIGLAAVRSDGAMTKRCDSRKTALRGVDRRHRRDLRPREAVGDRSDRRRVKPDENASAATRAAGAF
jgi:hypothetical protein